MSDLHYRILNKGWYYSFLTINDLNSLVKELLELRDSDVKRYYINKHYINILASDIGDRAPILFNFLKEAGLEKKFQRLLYSAYYGGSEVAHVDSYDPKYCSVSLNLPLLECEKSYTAWYSTRKKKLNDITTTGRDPTKFGHSIGQHFAFLPLDQTTEICRAEVIRPMLVNTTILHRGIVPRLNRTICGIRFNSELTNEEVLALGIEHPFKQVD
jgi:hypothetical protein